MKRKLHLNNYSLKNKKEGFTLVELLAIITIITLISSIAAYSIIHIINNSKEKSLAVTEQNIKKTAANYVKENEDTAWTTTPDNPNEEFSCISFQELINEGYFKEDIVKNEALKNKTTDFIIIKRELNSQTIISEDFDETEKCAANFKYIEQPSCNKNLVYNTTEQTLIPETSYYTFQNNKQTNAGEYNVKVKPNKDVEGNQDVWKNGRTNEVTIKCSISKAETIITLDPTAEIDGQVTFYKTSATPLIKDSNIQENIDGTFTIASSNQEYVKVNQKKIENITIGSKTDINLTAITERKKDTEIKITFTPNNSNYAKSSSIYTLAKTGTTDIYTVTLDANGGNMNNYPTNFQVLKDRKYGTYLNAIPTNPGYKFEGWYTDPTNGTLKTKDDTTINSNHTLYAHWKESDYTVTLDANGGTVTPNTVTVTYNNNYPNLPTPSNPGYKFEGWYTDPKNGTQITNTTKVTKTSNHTLYAHWKANNYIVTLDQQNATTKGTTSVTATYGSAMPSITLPSREYTVTYNANGGSVSTTSAKATYTFGGYYTDTNGSNTAYYNSNGTSARAWDIANNRTLYAKWNSASVTLPTPSRTGYIFQGWYTAASGGTKIGGAENSYTPTSNITLYAQWSIITYTVSYDANSGSGAPNSQTKNYGQTLTLSSTKPTKTGYIFKNWNTQQNGSGTNYNPGESYTNNSSTTLYAIWTPKQVKVTFKDLSSSNNDKSQIFTYEVSDQYFDSGFTKKLYEAVGWATSSGSSTKAYDFTSKVTNNWIVKSNTNVNLYVIWKDNAHPLISWNPDYKNAQTKSLTYYNNRTINIYYTDQEPGSGIKKLQAKVILGYSNGETHECNDGKWRMFGSSDICTAAEQSGAVEWWRAYRVIDNDGNHSKIICSYHYGTGTISKSRSNSFDSSCTVHNRTFSH